MRIENGIYYTDEELTITNIYDVIKNGFEEALELAVRGEVKGFAALGFDKKYGWNGTTYYELINLDYQDLTEYNPDTEEQQPAAADTTADTDALRAEVEELRVEVEKLKPYAEKYIENSDLIELVEGLKLKDKEKLMEEIERMKEKISQIASDAQSILDRIQE